MDKDILKLLETLNKKEEPRPTKRIFDDYIKTILQKTK
jgi:hypothetical protein